MKDEQIEQVDFTVDVLIPDERATTAMASTVRFKHLDFALVAHGVVMSSKRTGTQKLVPWPQVKEVHFAQPAAAQQPKPKVA